MTIARTEAAGGGGLLPEILRFSSSLPLDRALWREDLLGSLAHVTMLARQGIVSAADAAALRGGLVELWEAGGRGELAFVDEEDIHMAIEAELARRLGDVAGRLHSARSRNDQVALDLRLHVRERCTRALTALADLVDELCARAGREPDVVLPGYTHRQRAQPISLGYWLASYASMFARDAEAVGFVLDQADAMPLGVGALAGSSLPIDRELVRGLLGFSRLTLNGLDTVGDRDFVLDFAYAAARAVLHAGRLSADLVEMATAEFGFVKLPGTIACGSSMMPQKRNPDVFELIRGKGGRAVGNLVGLLTMVKGLSGGYHRDLQEDRAPLLEQAALLEDVLAVLCLAFSQVTFDAARTRAALDGDYTQATDVAEALVRSGLPFRSAYQAAGRVVRRCQDAGLPLAAATAELVQAACPELAAAGVAAVLSALVPADAVLRRESAGGTGPGAVQAQLDSLRQAALRARARARQVDSLQHLFERLRAAPLAQEPTP